MESDMLKVLGRSSELIVRNGENISAPALEALLSAHPAIADVAVVGKRDPIVGDRICALCVLHNGDKKLGIEDLADLLVSRNVEKWRWPESVVIVDEIPRTASGKVLRRILWDLVNVDR